MTSIQRQSRIFAVFVAWTLTSFLCHYMAKRFLSIVAEVYGETLDTTVLSVLLLTSAQTLFCIMVIDRPESDTSSNNWAITYILSLHVLATLMTNSSMAVLFAASTFAIKLLEPITGAIAQRLLLGTKLSLIALLSLPIIVSGAMMFTGNPLTEVTMSFGTTLACISNVSLALRNVAIKKEHTYQTEIRWHRRGSYLLVIYLVVVSLYSIFQYFSIKETKNTHSIALALAFIVGSSLFHVTYSYISTAIVLKELSVVSHAVGNIFKRLLVIMLLYLGGTRTATVSNFLGLVICTAGLTLYTWDKVMNKTVHVSRIQEPVEDVEPQQS